MSWRPKVCVILLVLLTVILTHIWYEAEPGKWTSTSDNIPSFGFIHVSRGLENRASALADNGGLYPLPVPKSPIYHNELKCLQLAKHGGSIGVSGPVESRAAAPVDNGGLSPLPVFREAPVYLNELKCLQLSKDRGSACHSKAVHVVMTLDVYYVRGSMAAIYSILEHAKCPENIIFHFIVSDREEELRATVNGSFPQLEFRMHHFDESVVKGRISSSVRSALEHPLNYARNYLTALLEPCMERVIYLDSDVIVVDDIFKLWNTSLIGRAIGAPVYCQANFSRYFTSSFWSDGVLRSTFDGKSPCYFNTGVMIIDLEQWRRENYTRMIEKWMHIQKDHKRIYELGSLPPLLLVFAGNVQPIDHRWNKHGLGGDNLYGECRELHPGPVSLFHWSGKGKPWVRLDSKTPCPLDVCWAPYDLMQVF